MSLREEEQSEATKQSHRLVDKIKDAVLLRRFCNNVCNVKREFVSL